eukprot:173831_1
MGASYSKGITSSKLTTLKCTLNGESLSHAISLYIYREAQKHNIQLPFDLITICIKMVSFIMGTGILCEREKSDLFDHLKCKLITKNKMKIVHCQLIYQHKYINKFNLKLFTETLVNKSNLLILFCTEFNHVIRGVGNNQMIEQEMADCKMYILLLRSQFLSQQCPKELQFRHTNVGWQINNKPAGMGFGGFVLREDPINTRRVPARGGVW